MNKLYYGDNLDILRRYIPDESVDLIYLDPPFNSKRDYNAVFTGKGGQKAAAQIEAFEDTWRWDDSAAEAYDDVVVQGNHQSAAECLKALRKMLGTTDMLAYLSMMSVRLIELRRCLKPTGSIYLHCDTTMSHYLKVLMDSIFDVDSFVNEIVWQRTNSHNTALRYGKVHDVILFYAKDPNNMKWVPQYAGYSPEQLSRYKKDSNGRLYTCQDLTASRPNSNSGKFEWRGTMPTAGRGWGYTLEQLEEWWSVGRIATKKDGTPRMDGKIVYLDEMKGKPLIDVWTDIERLSNTAAERLGYPTQKPEALLERVIGSVTTEGDVVMDPFCGCGTTVAAAQKLNRHWIGIDITHLAVNLIRSRLIDTFGDTIKSTFTVVGEPTTLEDAESLAEQDKYQFQFWSLGLIGARPEASDEKKGSDKGIDGKRFFSDELRGSTKTIIISVKGGKTIPATAVRDLRGTMEREEAEMGVLISIAEPTKNMREDAAAAGFYESAMGTRHMRIQLLTIKQLLEGKTIDMPSINQSRRDVETTKKAKRQSTKDAQEGLGL